MKGNPHIVLNQRFTVLIQLKPKNDFEKVFIKHSINTTAIYWRDDLAIQTAITWFELVEGALELAECAEWQDSRVPEREINGLRWEPKVYARRKVETESNST